MVTHIMTTQPYHKRAMHRVTPETVTTLTEIKATQITTSRPKKKRHRGIEKGNVTNPYNILRSKSTKGANRTGTPWHGSGLLWVTSKVSTLLVTRAVNFDQTGVVACTKKTGNSVQEPHSNQDVGHQQQERGGGDGTYKWDSRGRGCGLGRATYPRDG